MKDARFSSCSNDPQDPSPCLHSRLVDYVRMPDGQATGQLRCLECGTIIPDPFNEHEPTAS